VDENGTCEQSKWRRRDWDIIKKTLPALVQAASQFQSNTENMNVSERPGGNGLDRSECEQRSKAII